MKKFVPIIFLAACGSSSENSSFEGTYNVSLEVKSSTCALPVTKTDSTTTWKITQAGEKCTVTFDDGTQSIVDCANNKMNTTDTAVLPTSGCNVNATDVLDLTLTGGNMTGTETVNAAGSCLPACVAVVNVTAIKQ